MKKILLIMALVVAGVGAVILFSTERNTATSNTETDESFVLGEQTNSNQIVIETNLSKV